MALPVPSGRCSHRSRISLFGCSLLHTSRYSLQYSCHPSCSVSSHTLVLAQIADCHSCWQQLCVFTSTLPFDQVCSCTAGISNNIAKPASPAVLLRFVRKAHITWVRLQTCTDSARRSCSIIITLQLTLSQRSPRWVANMH